MGISCCFTQQGYGCRICKYSAIFHSPLQPATKKSVVAVALAKMKAAVEAAGVVEGQKKKRDWDLAAMENAESRLGQI